MANKKIITDRKNIFIIGEKEPLISIWRKIQWEKKFL
jgi:hypothetical protein